MDIQGGGSSRIVLRFLERFENTQNDKVRSFIEAANAEFHDRLNLPYKILIKSNGHHYDVKRWVSNVT